MEIWSRQENDMTIKEKGRTKHDKEIERLNATKIK
jgi:hypothetical protein